MKKRSVVKYGVFLVLSLTLLGQAPGCQKMVNLYNNLVLSGEDFTARLECTGGVWESFTAQLSTCSPVIGQLCDCKFYANGQSVGTFSGCFDFSSCPNDATMILQLNGDEPGLFRQCVTTCGDSISEVNESIDYEELLDFTFIPEEGEELLELIEDRQ